MRRSAPRILAAAALVLAVGGAATAQDAQRFPDVPPEHPAFEAVEWAAEAGVTTGYTDGTFRPEVPLSKRHALVFVERFYDDVLGATESEAFTRGDMMRVLHAMKPLAEPDDSLFVDPFPTAPVPPDTSILDVRLGDAPWFRFAHTAAHSDRDVSKWPVRGWMRLTCSSNGWSAVFVISGDATTAEHYRGLNISLDGGPVRGVRTTLLGHPHNNQWQVGDADALVAWMVRGSTLKVTTTFRGEGVSFDVSELRLFRDFVPDRCRW